MMDSTIERYNNVLADMNTCDGLYKQAYELYMNLSDDTLRLSQSFWVVLMSRLNQLLQLVKKIENHVFEFPEDLKASLASRFDEQKTNILELHSCCAKHPKIKNNWVRVRIWKTGYYSGGKFIETSVLTTVARDAITENRCYGHASIETPNGYLSHWPANEGDIRESSLNSLFRDLWEEGPDCGAPIPDEDKRIREPETIDLFCLDAAAVEDFCIDYVRKFVKYTLKPKTKVESFRRSEDKTFKKPEENCITVVLKALQKGGLFELHNDIDLVNEIFSTPTPASFAKLLRGAQAKQEQLFSGALTRCAVIEHEKITESKPARHKPANIFLRVTQPYTPRFGRVQLTEGDKLLLDSLQPGGMLLCRKDETHLLVPSDRVEVDLTGRQMQPTPSYNP
jgi:hypothetical protein